MVNESFSDIFKRLRRKEGYTQRELAKAIGVSNTYIYFIEHDRYLPALKSDFVNRVAEVLKIDESTLRSALEYARACKKIPTLFPPEMAKIVLTAMEEHPWR